MQAGMHTGWHGGRQWGMRVVMVGRQSFLRGPVLMLFPYTKVFRLLGLGAAT